MLHPKIQTAQLKRRKKGGVFDELASKFGRKFIQIKKSEVGITKWERRKKKKPHLCTI